MNITKLIPYLLNKITKVERGLSTIDFTPYQAKSEKNVSSGYLGLDINRSIDSISYLQPKGIYYGYSLTSQLTIGVSSINGATSGYYKNANNAKVKSSTSTILYSYQLKLNASTISSANLFSDNGTINNYHLENNIKSIINVGLSIKDTSSIKSRTIAIGVGALNLQTSENFNGFGVFLSYNPTINSGKWRLGKRTGGITTYVNLDIFPTFDTLNHYRFENDKTINNFKIYINNVLIYELTESGSDFTLFSLCVSMGSSDATDTSTDRAVSIYSSYSEFYWL